AWIDSASRKTSPGSLLLTVATSTLRAMPAFPGAATTRTPGSRPSRQQSACSRAPDPTTNIFIRINKLGKLCRRQAVRDTLAYLALSPGARAAVHGGSQGPGRHATSQVARPPKGRFQPERGCLLMAEVKIQEG